jgi:hypothetical protein
LLISTPSNCTASAKLSATFTANARELGHQLLVDVQPSAGVHDQHVLALLARTLQRPRCDIHRVAFGALLVDVRPRLRAHLDELLDRRRPVHVAGGHRHRAAVLDPQVPRQLRGGSRLARALQTGHHDHRWWPRSRASAMPSNRIICCWWLTR